jgi:MFS family permease
VSRLAELVVPPRLGRSFRWLLASTWVTNLGDGITLAAGPLLVASQTRSPLAVAMAALLQRLPWLMFGLYAGVLADRVSRRVIVITTGLARVAILLLLIATILTHSVDTAVVLGALFLFGVGEAFGDTTTSTLLPMLVDKRDLGIANARSLTGVVVWNQLAGPPVGAALFAAGMALPFVSEAVLVLAGVLLFTRVQLPADLGRARPARVRDDIREGWRWLWAHPAIRTLAITIFTFNLTYGAAWSVLVLYARERLGLAAIGLGLITTAMAVGGLAGASRPAGRHYAGRPDHRDADRAGACTDAFGLVRAGRLRGLRRAFVYLGNDGVQRAAAFRACRVPGPGRQCLPHRSGRRHRDRLGDRRPGRFGLGRDRAVLVCLCRLRDHPGFPVALAPADRARGRGAAR